MQFLHKKGIDEKFLNDIHYTKNEHLEYNINYREDIIMGASKN